MKGPSGTGTSVLFGQKQRGQGSIRFGDDPELLGFRDLIAAQQSESMLQAQLVFSLVFLIEISPLCGITSFLDAHVSCDSTSRERWNHIGGTDGCEQLDLRSSLGKISTRC